MLRQNKFFSTGKNWLMKKYMCLICGWVYDESEGCPDEGIPSGTKWEDIPITWACPECGAQKSDFEMVEI
tara:strand:+ start:537 stop:746 length:210 start_codon:yes stop_codon:yes gene_type:complete